MSEPTSTILISKDIESALEYALERFREYRVVSFFKPNDEFLLEDAKAVVKEAYIAESKPKILILGAKGYRIEAQNSLLKILEEPPKNIVFILIAPSRTLFLPTILSRLAKEEIKSKSEPIKTGLNLKNLSEWDIFNFVKENSRSDKNRIKELIQTVVNEAITLHKINFTQKEMDSFVKLLELANLNSRAQNLLLNLLLIIKDRKNSEI